MAASTDPNLFTPAQESDLGDAIAEHMQRSIPIVNAGREIDYLNQLGARLLAHMPNPGIQFRFHLIDIAQANAFVLPGGRVFVSRKIVAFVRSEDELAGIIGHEMGHVLARQGSRRITRILKSGLGVQSVGDRADVFDKYNKLLDGSAKRSVTGPKYVDEEVAADQLSLYALARAGYDPEAMIAFFDRLTENKGATGGVISDFFSITRPESKRVREMTRTLAAMPAACRDSSKRPSASEFEAWRTRVAALAAVRAVSSLAPVQSLMPRLRPDITHITFSPDGVRVAAQDDSGINISNVAPFAVRFRIPAPDAQRAVFSPDSKSIHFLTATQRVESWDLATGSRLAVREVVTGRTSCAQRVLAPGGRTLACRTPDNDLQLYDIETNTLIVHKQFTINALAQLLMLVQGIANQDEEMRMLLFAFSPDGKYFLASPRGGTSVDSPWAYDLEARANLPLPGPIKGMLPGGFAFMGAERVAAIKPGDTNKSAIYRWPSGEVLQKVAIPGTWIEGVTRGSYLILRPFREHAAAVMDVNQGMIIKAGRMAALDIYDKVYVAERGTGELGLYPMEKNEPLAVVNLPEGQLGQPRAAAISPDLSRVVLSTQSRSGLWKLGAPEPPVRMRGFSAAAFANNDQVLVDMPALQTEPRRLLTVDLGARKLGDSWEIPEKQRHLLRGSVLYQTDAIGEGNKRRDTVVARDAARRSTLWETIIDPDASETFTSDDAVVTVFGIDTKFAKQTLRNPAVRERLFGPRKPSGRILQILSARDGKELGLVAVEEPGLAIRAVRMRGTVLFLGDGQNRVHVYDIATGQSRGKVFGRMLAIDATGAALCVENEPGDLRIHETGALAERARWQLDSPALVARFDEAARRLVVVTALQNVFDIAVEAN